MLSHLLEKIARSLEEQGIDYMIIGGQAVLVHGQPRLTQDIDITLGIGPDRLADMLALMEELGWTVLVEEPEKFVHQTLVLPVQEPNSGIRLDFVFSFSPYEHQALQRVHKITIGQTQVRFASPEDLIIHKMIAGRPRDLEDVKGILIKHSDIDQDYIRHWLKQFEDTLAEPFVKRFEQLWEESR